MQHELYLISDGQYNAAPHGGPEDLDTSTVIIVEGQDAIPDAITKLANRLCIDKEEVVVNGPLRIEQEVNR